MFFESTSSAASAQASSGSFWTRYPLGWRLVAGYAVLFIGSVVVLGALAYGLLIYFLQQPDRAFMEAQARQLAATYEDGGPQALRRMLERNASDEQVQELVVRLTNDQGDTFFLHNPDNWQAPDLDRLAAADPPDPASWIPLGAAQDQDPIEAFALRIAPDRILQVGMDAPLSDEILRSMKWVFLASALPVLLIALIGGMLLAHRALRPLRTVVHTFETIIETGDVGKRAPVPEVQGEFAQLAHLFNQMLDRIERLVEGMRTTLDNVAHDLRTPMTRLRGQAELAVRSDAATEEELRNALAETLNASDAVLDVLETILNVAEMETGTEALQRSRIAVSDLAATVVDAYQFVADEKDITLTTDIPHTLLVQVDAGRMRQALANLLDNAVKYTPQGGCVTVQATAWPNNDAYTACLTVRDTGIGIPAHEQPRIWDRLYRGDQSRTERGLGLGLSLVQAIVQAHEGRVEVESATNEGTAIHIWLP